MLSRILPRHLRNVAATGWRVLRSGNRIGIFQLFLYAASIAAIPFDLLLWFLLRLFGGKARPPEKPVIFISGYARSGTTLVYQALAGLWDVEYLSNVLVPFHRSYVLANWLYRRLSRARPTGFENYYGLTWGLSGTNDGGQIFYGLIPERYWVGGEPLPEAVEQGVVDFFGLHEAWLGKPILTKNCNNYLMFETYARLLPTARFIFVKRDPARIVRSTLKAREFVQGDRKASWEFTLKGRRPGGADEDPVEEIARNVKDCYARIDDIAASLPPDRLQVIRYEDFCADPVAVTAALGQAVLGVDVDLDVLRRRLAPFCASEGPAVEAADLDRIRAVVDEVFGEGGGS